MKKRDKGDKKSTEVNIKQHDERNQRSSNKKVFVHACVSVHVWVHACVCVRVYVCTCTSEYDFVCVCLSEREREREREREMLT